MGISQRIQELLDERQWNVPDLVRRSDKLTDKAIYAAMKRDSAGVQVVMGLAEAFEISTDEVLGRTRPDAPLASQGVPVVGTVQAGDDGYWDELQYPVGHGDGFIRYPSRDQNAYALRVKGDSMRPRIKPGEFILVEPNTPVIPGEEVLVTTKDGRSMVKLLGPRRDGMIELQSINEDHRPITIDEAHVRVLHYVAAIVKSSRYYRDN